MAGAAANAVTFMLEKATLRAELDLGAGVGASQAHVIALGTDPKGSGSLAVRVQTGVVSLDAGLLIRVSADDQPANMVSLTNHTGIAAVWSNPLVGARAAVTSTVWVASFADVVLIGKHTWPTVGFTRVVVFVSYGHVTALVTLIVVWSSTGVVTLLVTPLTLALTLVVEAWESPVRLAVVQAEGVLLKHVVGTLQTLVGTSTPASVLVALGVADLSDGFTSSLTLVADQSDQLFGRVGDDARPVDVLHVAQVVVEHEVDVAVTNGLERHEF